MPDFAEMHGRSPHKSPQYQRGHPVYDSIRLPRSQVLESRWQNRRAASGLRGNKFVLQTDHPLDGLHVLADDLVSDRIGEFVLLKGIPDVEEEMPEF